MNFDTLPEKVTIYEVGPRDGLQNEPRQVSTANKLAFIDALCTAGISRVEITSFVSPQWIPQLADAVEVARRAQRPQGARFSALVPNRFGLDRALEAGMQEIAVFLSASETHNRKNVNKSIAQTLRAFDDVVAPALAEGLRVRAYVSTAFGCPFEGEVDPRVVVELAQTLRELGVYQVSVGDTIGVANPMQVQQVLEQLLRDVPAELLALHFHDTQGTALANCLVGLGLGISTIDSSVGGLGGCPYAPGASGNLATEDVVSMLHAMGVETGVDLDLLIDCSRLVASFVGHELPSKYLKAHMGKRSRRHRGHNG